MSCQTSVGIYCYRWWSRRTGSLERLRRFRPGLPVLFMTGYTQSAASRSEFLAPGMEMITKPFAMDELAAKIREMLAGNARLGKASGL